MVSVTLVCGLPRVGKTMLINHVRGSDPEHRVSALLDTSGSPAEVAAQVRGLAADGDTEHLLIELTAAQDPAPYATALSAERSTARVDTVVAVMDAETVLGDFCCQDLVAQRLPQALADNRSWVDALTDQVEFADLIVVNKVDRVPLETRRSIRTLLAALNPGARVLESEFGAVPMHELLATGRFNLERAHRRSAWSAALAGEDIPNARAHGLHAFVYRRRRPFHPQRFMSFLNEPWQGVIRARGTFWLATRMDWKAEVSHVGSARRHRAVSAWWATALETRTFDPREAEELTGAPWDAKFGDRMQEIAFIGLREDLDEQALNGALDACLLDDLEMQRGREAWQAYTDPFPPWGLEISVRRHGAR